MAGGCCNRIQYRRFWLRLAAPYWRGSEPDGTNVSEPLRCFGSYRFWCLAGAQLSVAWSCAWWSEPACRTYRRKSALHRVGESVQALLVALPELLAVANNPRFAVVAGEEVGGIQG